MNCKELGHHVAHLESLLCRNGRAYKAIDGCHGCDIQGTLINNREHPVVLGGC